MMITTMTNHTHHCTAHHLGLGQERYRPGPGHEYPDNSRATRADAAAQCEFLAAERPRGVFSRQLVLGDNLDLDRVQAGYRDGVLRLVIPVAEKAKPRKIAIDRDGDADQAITTGNGHRDQAQDASTVDAVSA